MKNSDSRDLGLRGDRFAPLTCEAMTSRQRVMTDAVLAGKRASMQGPYNVLPRSPAMDQLAQAFGEQVRFESSLLLRLNGLARPAGGTLLGLPVHVARAPRNRHRRRAAGTCGRCDCAA